MDEITFAILGSHVSGNVMDNSVLVTAGHFKLIYSYVMVVLSGGHHVGGNVMDKDVLGTARLFKLTHSYVMFVSGRVSVSLERRAARGAARRFAAKRSADSSRDTSGDSSRDSSGNSSRVFSHPETLEQCSELSPPKWQWSELSPNINFLGNV